MKYRGSVEWDNDARFRIHITDGETWHISEWSTYRNIAAVEAFGTKFVAVSNYFDGVLKDSRVYELKEVDGE